MNSCLSGITRHSQNYRLFNPRSLEAQEEWKKKLAAEVKQIQPEYPDADVEIWCEDEHGLKLQPVTRQVWVEAGEVPIATVNWKRE